MINRLLVPAAICTLMCSFILLPVVAEAPQPGVFQIALMSNTVSIGEPLILKYKITNTDLRRVAVNVADDQRGWLKMTLCDVSGHSLQALPDPLPVSRHPAAGIEVDPNSQYTGYVIASQKFQPTHPGSYQLRLSAHLTYSTDGGQSVSDQTFSFPVTVTTRDSQQLRSTAEGLRQTVLHDQHYRPAIKALFAMRDPDCLSVWRELATDPNLDAFRATEVINELTKVNSISASDILAEMQTISSERWARTGLDPLNALEGMRRNANPELRQHINQLLVAAGVDLNHVPYGSVN